jgi:RHS repeat-associated protein
VTKCSAESLVATASATNQLSAATYDSAGNAYQANGVNFIFDAAGRIIAAAGVTYVYDGSGERVSKTGKLYWRGAGSDTLAETSATDTNPMRYIFFDGKRIARLDPGATTPKYYVEDNVGSTELVTDYLGNPLSESLFFPYGGEQVILANDTNTYKFSGKERDVESGLDDFGARYYASTLGRFMSPDWEAKPTAVPYASFGDPQTLNLYAYVENAPLNRVDADGHAGDSNLHNNWIALNGDWSLGYLAYWHDYCLGLGWFPSSVRGDPGSNAVDSIYAELAANEAEEAMQTAQTKVQNQQKPTDTVTVNAYEGAHGLGHVGLGVDSTKTEGLYPAHEDTVKEKAKIVAGEDVPGAVHGDTAKKTDTVTIQVTAKQADAVRKYVSAAEPPNSGTYNLYGRNCARFVEGALKSAGVKSSDTVFPHDLMKDLHTRYDSK